MSTPLDFGKVEVKVLRDKKGNPCIVYMPYYEGEGEYQNMCTIKPDGSYEHENLTELECYKRFYRQVNRVPHRRPFTLSEAEYYLQKYCRHFRMERSAFVIMEKFGRRRSADENRNIMKAPNNGYHSRVPKNYQRRTYNVQMYGKWFSFESLGEAVAWCTDGLANTEGAERDRYVEALTGFKSGWNYVNTDDP